MNFIDLNYKIQNKAIILIERHAEFYSFDFLNAYQTHELKEVIDKLLKEMFVGYRNAYNDENQGRILSIYVEITAVSLVYEEKFSIVLNEEQKMLKHIIKFKPCV